MAEPFLAEVKIISWNFPPKGWAFCNGQFLPINQNQALFSILGTTYGGNGQTTFALPDLQGRVPFHVGNGLTLGEKGGETTHTINQSEMPAHNHVPVGSNTAASVPTPVGNLWASAGQTVYAAASDSTMNPADILPVGGSQPHNNLSPYLVLNFI